MTPNDHSHPPQIEKCIPIPHKRAGTQFYPFDKMEIGDSFFMSGDKIVTSISASITYAQRKFGRKFTRRSERGGVRVWRIE